MGDALKKVQSGSKLRIPAAAYNAFIDTAMDLYRRQQTQEQSATPAPPQTGIILIRNDSGEDRERFDVLGISDTVIAPSDNLAGFKNKVALAGVTPTQADHAGRFVVLLEPILDGKMGYACAAGVTVARLDVTSESHQFADVADNDAGKLASGESGAAAILWKEAGTGTKWAVIRIGAGGGGAGTILATITQVHATEQWKVGWAEVYVADDGEISTFDGSREGTLTTDPAYEVHANTKAEVGDVVLLFPITRLKHDHPNPSSFIRGWGFELLKTRSQTVVTAVTTLNKNVVTAINSVSCQSNGNINVNYSQESVKVVDTITTATIKVLDA